MNLLLAFLVLRCSRQLCGHHLEGCRLSQLFRLVKLPHLYAVLLVVRRVIVGNSVPIGHSHVSTAEGGTHLPGMSSRKRF